MRRFLIAFLLGNVLLPIVAKQYEGRVVDIYGEGIGYATVYPESDPVAGTATNNEGYFRIETDLPEESAVVISFIGYEKQTLPLTIFAIADTTTLTIDSALHVEPTMTEQTQGKSIATIVLHEQPIALEETVIAAKPSKQRNKRKQMAALLHAVYVQMEENFANTPTRYRVVSDVRMDSEGEAWGMEQMISSIVVLPEAAHDGKDSVQFAGEYCKRFFKPTIRALADTILAGDGLERIDKNMRKAATAVDSGVVVHKSLFAMGNVRYDFEQWVGDVRNWSISNESESETVLSHREKYNFLGIFKYIVDRHYILNSETLSVQRFSEYGEIAVNIPFGKKLNKDQLQILNLLNMDDEQIEKFRLRKMRANIHLNTIYQEREGHLYIKEKNLHTDAKIIGSRKMEIPIQVSATQRVTAIQTEEVVPLNTNQITHRVTRQIVELY